MLPFSTKRIVMRPGRALPNRRREISAAMNSIEKEPLYISKPSPRSLWQQYRIYHNRLELKFWLFFKTLNIPASKIVDIKVVPSGFKRKKNSNPVAWFWGLFLDWAAFNRHVLVETRSYFARYLHFTPDDPDAFLRVLESIRKKADADPGKDLETMRFSV